MTNGKKEMQKKIGNTKDNSMNNIKILNTAIEYMQKQLINRTKQNGICENFGQREVRILEDKFINTSDYSNEMNLMCKTINKFDNWCSSYNG